MDDEKDVTVSQETWHAFLNTSFNGDIRDNFPPFIGEHFIWPEDFKQCSVGDQDCFEFMMDFSSDPEIDLTCNPLDGADDPSMIECWDQASKWVVKPPEGIR